MFKVTPSYGTRWNFFLLFLKLNLWWDKEQFCSQCNCSLMLRCQICWKARKSPENRRINQEKSRKCQEIRVNYQFWVKNGYMWPEMAFLNIKNYTETSYLQYLFIFEHFCFNLYVQITFSLFFSLVFSGRWYACFYLPFWSRLPYDAIWYGLFGVCEKVYLS